MKAINAAHHRARIVDPKLLDTQLEEWEGKLERLHIDYGEVVSNKVRLAILYSMLPREIHERMLDRCSMQWSSLREDDVAKAVLSMIDESKRNLQIQA